MGLFDSINNDMLKAMKERDRLVLSVLRMVKGAIQLEKIAKKHDLTDDEVLDVVLKQIKMRKDSIVEFEKASRDDLVLQNKQELEILSLYIPKQLSLEEVLQIIDDTFSDIKPNSIKDLGLIMKNVMPKVKGKTDINELNKIIKERLNSL